MRTSLAVLLMLGLAACRPAPRLSGPFPHGVYVWQRVWGEAVRSSLSQAQGMTEFVVLAAQISPGKACPVRPEIDFAALAATGKPVGLAIRIDPYFGPFQPGDRLTRRIVSEVTERVAAARASGIEPAEVQIDFDCAEGKLDGYRVWLREVRNAVKPLPVCPTVLPSWLSRAEFAQLARDCGRYVLQVHCVSPPRSETELRHLTEPDLAEGWVEQAAAIGVPFRVALPTYAYLVAFDEQGKPLGVAAEGSAGQWPSGTRVVRWEAEASAMAALVAKWSRSRPPALAGVIWYRLPVAGDALNWRWPTLNSVMSGRTPLSRLVASASGGQPTDISLVNEGEGNEPLPARVEVATEGVSVLAADALTGYTLERSESGIAFIRGDGARLLRLPPGSRRPIGWVRCESTSHFPLRITVSRPAADEPARDGN